MDLRRVASRQILDSEIASAELALAQSDSGIIALGLKGAHPETLSRIRAKNAAEMGLSEAQLEMLAPFLQEIERFKDRLQDLQKRLEAVVKDNRRLLPLAPIANRSIPPIKVELKRPRYYLFGPQVTLYKSTGKPNLNFLEWENAAVFRWICDVISGLSTTQVRLAPIVASRFDQQLFKDNAERDFVYRNWSGEPTDYVLAIRIIFSDADFYWGSP